MWGSQDMALPPPTFMLSSDARPWAGGTICSEAVAVCLPARTPIQGRSLASSGVSGDSSDAWKLPFVLLEQDGVLRGLWPGLVFAWETCEKPWNLCPVMLGASLHRPPSHCRVSRGVKPPAWGSSIVLPAMSLFLPEGRAAVSECWPTLLGGPSAPYHSLLFPP